MRIIGGKYRSRVLAEFAGKDVRPTSDRAKESLFNILALKIPQARVLDLFTGSGNLGLESLSRGAKEVVFNDISKESLAIVKKNLTALKIPVNGAEAKVCNYDYATCLETVQGEFDVIFLDPPYALEVGEKALQTVADRGLLSKNGVAVYERDVPFSGKVTGLKQYDERRYGKAYLTFFTRGEEDEN